MLTNQNGVYVDQTTKWNSKLTQLGMVTDFVFSDINNDNNKDLIIVGEWETIKVFINQGDSSFIACGDEFKIVIKSSCSLFMVTLDLYLTPSIIDEIISFSDDTRLYEETKQWFNG